MEVKIKIGGEIIDATIEMVDGVMVVSPKEVKFEPKDGDIVRNDNAVIAIFKIGSLITFNSYAAYYHGEIWINEGFSTVGISLATEEEKKLLFDKLKEEGWEWDAEKKELVELKWKPRAGQRFYIPAICNAQFKAVIEDWSDDARDILYFDKGWCFKTKEECQAFCEKLNQAIEGVKP